MEESAKKLLDEALEAATDAHIKVINLEHKCDGLSGIWAVNERNRYHFYKGVRLAALELIHKVLGGENLLHVMAEMFERQFQYERDEKIKAKESDRSKT